MCGSDMSEKGFVFTGMALLMIIPVILLAASFSNMVSTGDRTVATTLRADVLFYAADNVKDSLERTMDDLVYKSDCGSTDVSAVKGNLTDVWAPYVEGVFAASRGLTISVAEEKINVTLADQYFNVSNVDTGGGIPVTISDPEGKSEYAFEVGPVIVRAYGAPIAAITLPEVFNISYDFGESVDFDASDSYDPDGDPLTYSWTSSIDGVLSDQVSFTTTTLSKGEHEITLTVDDGDCGQDSTTTVITLNETEVGYCVGLGYYTGTCEGAPKFCEEEANHIVHEAGGDALFCSGDETCCEHSLETWGVSQGYTTCECSVELKPADCSQYAGSIHEGAVDAIYCGSYKGEQQWVCCS